MKMLYKKTEKNVLKSRKYGLNAMKISADCFSIYELILLYYLFKVCPEGYHGDHCMMPCECKNDNFICHPSDGCICRHGFTGENCNTTLYQARDAATASPGNDYSGTVAGILVALIALTVIILLWMYYRRKVVNLKTEIAHVQYIADPQAFGGDRNHFDNPVYSYQGNGKRDEDRLLNNTHIIRNNLLKQNNAVLEKQRLGMPCCSTDDDDMCAKGTIL